MKTAIITGASRGIGRACAIELAKDYNYIAIISKTGGSNLEDTAIHIKKSGVSCDTFTGDVADYKFIQDTINNIISRTGRIDTLINNAGISKVGLFTDMSPTEWQEILSVNLTSIYNTCHCVLPHMIREKSGKIINISSVWGLVGASCEVAYSATKGAINSFTKALAKELAPSNISVNAIAFGAINTDMNNNLSIEEKLSLEDEIPYGKMATPEEAAMCVRNILSMPSYLTGEVIKFDGGWV